MAKTQRIHSDFHAPTVKVDTLEKLLSYISHQFEDQTVFSYEQSGALHQISYRQMEKACRRVGGFLQTKILTGESVAILGHGSHQWIEAFFGMVTIGAVAVLLPTTATIEELKSFVTVNKVRGILYGVGFEETAKTVTKSCSLSFCVPVEDGEQFRGVPAQPQRLTPDSPAAILFTSGTTGGSKSALLSHGNITASGFNPATRIPFHKGDRYLAVLPLHHIFGLTCGLITFLFDGAEIYFNENIKKLVQNLSGVKPATLVLVPALAEGLLTIAEKNGLAILGGALRTIVVGGAPMNPQIGERITDLGLTLFQGYGMTECGVVCSTNGEAEFATTIGKPFSGAELTLVDGEIWVRGETVFTGYLDESLNQTAFHEDWFMTGDLGAFDAQGNLSVIGRKKFVIITENGENVSPEELESLLSTLPSVQECLTYEGKNKAGRTIIVAEIYTPDGDEEDCRFQILQLNRQLPRHKQIESVVFRQESFPRNAMNKILRKGASS